MIRLTLNPHFDPQIYLFNQSTILIGSDSSKVDLPISDPKIHPIHLKIVKQNDLFILFNEANDPFASADGHPFGKRVLKSGESIVIHDTTLLFEIIKLSADCEMGQRESPSLLIEEVKKKGSLEPPDPTIVQPVVPFSFSLPFEEEVEILKEDEWESEPIKAYLKELELAKEPSPALKDASVSLKDDYLREWEDDHQRKQDGPFSHSQKPSYLYQTEKWLLLFIFSFLAIFALTCFAIYFNISDKTEAQETKVAQGVADVAMALLRTQLVHLKPHNQNWSDVDFLKKNLRAILPTTSSYASQIDAQGQFNCCPYSLRIYTNSNLSHFLLIAQPAPTLLYWLIPRSVIVLDSRLMELRSLKDIKSLNRLLANPDALEGMNEKEVTALIKQGELIHLSSLAAESGQVDFAPPKNLAWIHPGAENLIYNAPRYYRLGQELMQKAVHLSTSKGSSELVTSFKEEVKIFGLLKHCVLYSDQGKKTALLVRQGLKFFAPSEEFLFGYLLFNAQGKIHQAYLLREEEELKDSFLIAHAEQESTQPAESHKEKSSLHADAHPMDDNHPIYIQLHPLVSHRENDLKNWHSALTSLMDQELQTPHPDFQIEFQNLCHSYLMVCAHHKRLLQGALETLYHQYEEMPIDQFMAFIQSLRLEHLIERKSSTLTLADDRCQRMIENLLMQIKKSQSFIELDHLISMACGSLNLDFIKNPYELVKDQNLLRNQLLERIESLLLSTEGSLDQENQEALQRILNQERLIKPDEKDFFLEIAETSKI
jgi:hypothetical protein